MVDHDFLDGSFDAMAVSETWLKPCIPDSMVSTNGYNLIRKDRITTRVLDGGNLTKTKSGGGICLYLKTDMIYEVLTPIKNNCIDLEWLCVKTNRGGGKKHIIVVVYRPPNCSASKAIDCIRECLTYLNDEHKNSDHTMIGDLNFNFHNDKCSHVQTLKFLEKSFNVRQVIKSSTRIGRSSGSLINICITNMDKIMSSGVIEYHLSDHLPIYLIKKHPKQQKKDNRFFGRCYKNYSYELLKDSLNEENWMSVSRELNPDTQWNMMLTIFLKVADKLCPKKLFHITKHRPVYLTDVILEYIK